MADKLTIRINVDATNNQTVSGFAVTDNGHITFHNDAGATANVKFNGASPLCLGNNPQMSVDIDAGGQQPFKVCDGAGGLQYKYTATVAGAGPEDPILIIERSSSGGGSSTNPIFIIEMVPWIIGSFIFGAVAAYFVMKRRTTSK